MQITAGFEYESLGRGETILFIHGSIFCDSYVTLMREAELTSYQRVNLLRG
jgi:hypothetical protein